MLERTSVFKERIYTTARGSNTSQNFKRLILKMSKLNFDDADGVKSIGPKELAKFSLDAGKITRVSYIFFDDEVDDEDIETLKSDPERAAALKKGMYKIVDKDGVSYLRRPKFPFVKRHYKDGVGYFKCLTTNEEEEAGIKRICCQKGGNAQTQPTSLCVHYYTDDSGELLFGEEDVKFEVKEHKFSANYYNKLLSQNKQFPLISNDVMIQAKKQGQYVVLEPTPAPNCLWQQDPKMMTKVIKTAASHWERIKDKLCNDWDEETLKEKLGVAFERPKVAVGQTDIKRMADELDD